MTTSRTIVITGGAGGLGVAVTHKFLEEGDCVIVPVSGEASGTTLFNAMPDALRTRLTCVVADMSGESNVSRFFEEQFSEGKPLHALIHLIGGVRPWASVAET